MIPVYQTFFYEPGVPEEDQRGNCLQAVVASLTELPLDAVPHFVWQDRLGGPNWWWHLYKWLAMMGYEMKSFHPRNPPAGKYYTLSGKSPRGSEEIPIYHIVIFKDGKLVHDPVPDGEGNITYETGWYLEETGHSFRSAYYTG